MDNARGSTISKAVQEAKVALEEFLERGGVFDELESIADRIEGVIRAGGRILVTGNGGSLADAMHFAEELTGRFRNDRDPYAAIALGSDPTHLTCVANDYGFEHVFERLVRAYGRAGDLLILLTTSGNSSNLKLAALAAKENGLEVVGFTGKGGGELKSHCDVMIDFPGKTSDRIQELHMLCLHALVEAVEAKLA